VRYLTKKLGQWKDDKKTGQGVYIFKNGDKYEGKFENNMFHGKTSGLRGCPNEFMIAGQGVMVCANGTLVKGTWEKDKLHGKVTTVLENGKEIEEIYNRGEIKVRILTIGHQH